MKGLGSCKRGNGEGVGGGEWDGLRRVGGRPWPCSAETTSDSTSSGGSLNTAGLRAIYRLDVQYICRNMSTGEVRIKPFRPLNYPILHLQRIYWQLQVGYENAAC